MVLMDSSGIVRDWSSGYERITGLSKKAVVGKKHIWEVAEMLFPKGLRTQEECDAMVADLKEMVAGKQQTNIVRHIKHTKTGEYRVFNVHYFPVEMPDGMMMGGITRDISDETKYRETGRYKK